MENTPVDYRDLQGILRFGYGRLPEACFLLLQIDNAVALRLWLRDLNVSTAEEKPGTPETALQIAFTSAGLTALGLTQDILAKFSNEFLSGMAGEESRSRRLGDIGADAPAAWNWGGPENIADVLLMLYAAQGGLQAWRESVKATLPAAGLREIACLTCSFLDGKEPFGFVDGISQPKLDWERNRTAGSSDQLEYGNHVALGEFVLGYPNEYGKYTERPLLAAKDDPWAELWRAEDQPALRDLGRNGSYLVFRQLEQDVHTFWNQLHRETQGDAVERRNLAELMVGRTMEGKPLMPLASAAISGVGARPEDAVLNQFTYDADAFGERCPVGAHIRRANPRNADVPGKPTGILQRLLRVLGFTRAHIADDLIAGTRFHRILRRGRKYGATLNPEEAVERSKDSQERGIYFIGLVANISRQFEFVQNAWIMGTKFAGFTAESDPLLGNRARVAGCPATDGFSIPQANGVNRRITGLPQFVKVRGGAYFFLPSIRALRYLSRLGS